MRIKLTVAYNGSAFSGLQIQTRTPHTVIGTMQRILARIGIQNPLVASGRTDSGVHATGQVMHLDLPPHWHDLAKLHYTLNYQLPPTIRIRHIEQASSSFHARFDATRRTYRYLLSEHAPNPFEADFVTFVPMPLDLPLLNQGLALFVGTHDFSLFQKSGSTVSHTVRTVYKAFAYRYKGNVILTFVANGYLRSQIRIMVGALLALLQGKIDLHKLAEQRDHKHRHHTKLAPPNGLYLAHVSYRLTEPKPQPTTMIPHQPRSSFA